MPTPEQAERSTPPLQLQGFVITHELAGEMTPAQAESFMQNLRDDLGPLARWEIAPIWTPAPASEEAEVPLSKAMFFAHAREHSMPERRPGLAWNMVRYTHRHTNDPGDPYPAVRRLSDRADRELFDAWSIHDRLWASRLDPYAWNAGGATKVAFLASVVNSVLQLEVPLPTSKSEALRLAKDETYRPLTRAMRLTYAARQLIKETDGPL
jgi:hypothetical protein